MHAAPLMLTTALLITVLAPKTVLAQSLTPDSTLAREVRAFVENEIAQGRFSGVVMVARNRQPVVQIAGGQANQERALPITLDTRFNLASGDKLFTKIAILQLVQAGRLALDDTVGKFLPDYASATVRQKVTVEHLLRHQSGLGSYWNETFLRDRAKQKDLDDLVRLFEGEALLFEPGSRMGYSNNGYVLLGRIIEVVTKQSWYDFVQSNVFRPAGISRTAYLTLDEWPADRAIGYTTANPATGIAPGDAATRSTTRSDNNWSLSFRGSSAGGGYSAVGDLLVLDAALRSGALVDTARLARFTATGPGGRRVLANGGGPGANFEFTRIGDYTIIVLSNYDPPAATRVQQQIVTLLQNQTQSVREEIAKLNRSMMDAWRRNDPLAVAAHYSDDARIMGPSGDAIEGRTAVNQYWQGFPMQGRTWTLEVIEAGGNRDLAYQYGRSTIAGGARSQVVDFIGVWKRQANGELKLTIDYWIPSAGAR